MCSSDPVIAVKLLSKWRLSAIWNYYLVTLDHPRSLLVHLNSVFKFRDGVIRVYNYFENI